MTGDCIHLERWGLILLMLKMTNLPTNVVSKAQLVTDYPKLSWGQSMCIPKIKLKLYVSQPSERKAHTDWIDHLNTRKSASLLRLFPDQHATFRPHIHTKQEVFVCFLLGLAQQTFVNVTQQANSGGWLAAVLKCSHIPQPTENNGDKWCQLQTEQLTPPHQEPQSSFGKRIPSS